MTEIATKHQLQAAIGDAVRERWPHLRAEFSMPTTITVPETPFGTTDVYFWLDNGAATHDEYVWGCIRLERPLARWVADLEITALLDGLEPHVRVVA